MVLCRFYFPLLLVTLTSKTFVLRCSHCCPLAVVVPGKQALQPLQLHTSFSVHTRFPVFMSCHLHCVDFEWYSCLWIISALLSNPRRTLWFTKLDFCRILTLFSFLGSEDTCLHLQSNNITQHLSPGLNPTIFGCKFLQQASLKLYVLPWWNKISFLRG